MGEAAAQTQTVLIVDDRPLNIAVMAEYLERHGFRVLVAEDGAEGLQRAADFQPDLILLDVNLPDLDGFTVCRRLKANAATLQIPVIFMTALTDQQNKLEGFAAGGVDYVTKPLDTGEVAARVRTHLELNALRRQLASQNRLLTLAREDLERQIAERTADLATSNATYRSLIAAMAEGVVFRNSKGEITTINPAAERIEGRHADQMLGRTSDDPEWEAIREDGTPFPGDCHPAMVTLRTGKPQSNVVMGIRKPNGERAWISINSQPVMPAGATTPEAVVTTFHDVTELKQIERERSLQLWFVESLNRVNRSLQGTDDLETMMSDVLGALLEIFACDRAWLLYPCDPQATAIRAFIERTRPQFPGVLALGVDLPVDPEIAAVARRLIETGVPMKSGAGHDDPLPRSVSSGYAVRSCIMMALQPRGDQHWMFGLHRCVEDRSWSAEEEKLFREVGARLTDALSSLIAYRRLRESEQRYREVLQNSSDLIYVIDVDRDGRFRFGLGNPAWESAFGLQGELARGRYVDELVPAQRAQTVFARYRQCIEAGAPVEYEEELPMGGGARYFHAGLFPVRGEDGRIYRLLGIARDITERKRAEEELLRHREHLEELVAERTEELAASNRELEAFSYSVSHDLRTPLRAIDGFSRMLSSKYADRLDDEGKRLVRVVRDNATKMSELIDGILEFARSGRAALHLSKVDMERMVQAVWTDLDPDRAGREVHLEIGPLPPVRGDPNMLRQVWTNLLSNAIKFTRPRATARIEVGGAADAKDVVYFVKDNGTGFDPAYVHKLFGVFERLHGVHEFEGTGIGLAIVKRIVSRHGGRVWAQGGVDQGATFHFALPAGVTDPATC